MNEPNLHSLSSGLSAADGDDINCDETEVVGMKVHKQLDKVSVIDASIKRKDQVYSLDHLLPGIQVDKKKIHINPTLLLSGLIAIVQREEDMALFLCYELTTFPTSLFKNNALRKNDKSQLARNLKNNVEPSTRSIRAEYVLDGGALIHKVKWAKKGTYQDIMKQCASYVCAKYGTCNITFDGYQDGPSIKDHKHQRRVNKACADIQLHAPMKALLTRRHFSRMKETRASSSYY